MSSHREAPYISSDPVADNTDVYAFVSPDAPDTVTIIANFIPLEAPAGGYGVTTTAAVFGSLRAGRYELRIKDAPGTEHPAQVVVEPAQVTWVTWAGATSARSES